MPEVPSATTRELSMYDAGISALSELAELPRMTSLRSLNLHCNRIDKISHLEPLTQLQSLNLSSNLIEAITGLHSLTQLQSLDLSCNRINMIDGLATLRLLRRLLLSFNRISSFAGLVQCHGGALAHFEAYGNRVALLREAEYLRGLPRLEEAILRRHGQDNPICRQPGYRERLIGLLPTLRVLDDALTPAGEAAKQKNAQSDLPIPAALSEGGVKALGGGYAAGEAEIVASLGSLHSKIDTVASLASAAAAAGRPAEPPPSSTSTTTLTQPPAKRDPAVAPPCHQRRT